MRKFFCNIRAKFGTVVLAVLVLAAGNAYAQYPNHTITMIISVPAGASTDVMGRALAERLGTRLGQKIVVENRPGASSLLAAGMVAKAAPDGYTLLFAPNTMIIAPHLLPKGAAGGVDILHELAPVILAGSTPLLITAHPSLGVKNIKELIALAKRKPGMTYATSGVGSSFHITAELLQRGSGIQLTHVPYKGLAQAVTDVVSGQVETMFGAPGGVISQLLTSGKIIPLAVAQSHRSPLLPNVPTLAESGITGADGEVEFMLFAPAATPRAILIRLNQESAVVMQSAEVRERLAGLGVDAKGSTLQEVQAKVQADYERYGKLISEFNIKE